MSAPCMRAVCTLLATTLLLACRLPQSSIASPLLHTVPPVFALPPVPSGGMLGPSDFRGRVLIVDFWATWCEACRQSLPHLAAYANTHAADVALLAVSEDDDASLVPELLPRLGLARSAIDTDHRVADLWSLPPALPATFVVDRCGVVRKVFSGSEGDEEARVLDAVREWTRVTSPCTTSPTVRPRPE